MPVSDLPTAFVISGWLFRYESTISSGKASQRDRIDGTDEPEGEVEEAVAQSGWLLPSIGNTHPYPKFLLP